MRIWMAASEAAPLAKTGGLADVLGALPAALCALGVRVTLVIPDYPSCRAAAPHRQALGNFELKVAGRVRSVAVEASESNTGVRILFVRQPELFDRPGIYGDPVTGDYPDNLERFTFFCRATAALPLWLGESVDCFHCHDWHTALLAVDLANGLRGRPAFFSCGSVLTIHNLAFQGLFPAKEWKTTGLERSLFSQSGLLQGRHLSLLKGGILFADELTAVSPRYAEEIQTPALGFGLDEIFRRRRDALTGILNGIDRKEWNPATDSALASRYDAASWVKAKPVNRARLLEAAGMPERPGWPVAGFVGRLTEQKGLDLLLAASAEMLRRPVQWVFLGTGEPRYENTLRRLSTENPDRVSLMRRFDEPLARQVYAGADFYLMPSRFEPCGLSQLYALRYGTPPLVHAVGGLVDTVVDASPRRIADGTANGVRFVKFHPDSFLAAVDRMVELFEDREVWSKLVERGMTEDWSWDRSARQYLAVYERAIGRWR